MAVTVGDDNPNNLIGTNDNDTITGLGGNDTIQGLDGNDLIYGNLGNDNLAGNIGNDTVYGGQENDTIGGGSGNDLIYGNFGNDVISSSGNSTIYGGQGNDIVDAGSGNDLIYGNLGDDHIDAGAGNNTIYGGQGNDTLEPFVGENDLIYGNFGNDTINAHSGDNIVYGGQGNDFITEGGGKLNSDHLFGNLGADTFEFGVSPIPPSGLTQATADHISDFSDAQGDRIDIFAPPTGIHYVEAQSATVTSVETAISFANGMSLGSQGNVAFIAGATDGYLLVDANNGGLFDSVGDWAIVLDGLNSTTLFGPAD